MGVIPFPEGFEFHGRADPVSRARLRLVALVCEEYYVDLETDEGSSQAALSSFGGIPCGIG